MDNLSFPLEVRRDGSLARTGLEGAVSAIVTAAARTPVGPHTCDWCPTFGIRDLLESQITAPAGQPRPHLMREASHRLNATLKALAGPVGKIEVKPVPAAGGEGRAEFEINIAWADGQNSSLRIEETE